MLERNIERLETLWDSYDQKENHYTELMNEYLNE